MEANARDKAGERALVARCTTEATALLRKNLTPNGILAATPGEGARTRGYAAIFARDAAVCAIGMAFSGDTVLEEGAATGLETLAVHQAENGQIPKFVNVESAETDFWYLGCIDATLWWLIALRFLDARRGQPVLGTRFAVEVERALAWLRCQEHQRFFLLQQNEASDWADIMPRSGFVLYTNALWYHVKRLYGLAHLSETCHNFKHLFHPFSRDLTEYRRARLLTHYVRKKARNRDLYLSFVNFAFWGEEGDIFGNLLAILLGPAAEEDVNRVLDKLEQAQVHVPYPVRVVCDPITESHMLWRGYMSRHQQNFPWQYHNGGVWPFVGGFWVAALAKAGRQAMARAELAKLARANELNEWEFNEWLHGQTLMPTGMPGQSWNAAAFLMALRALEEPVFRGPVARQNPAT
ncbi:MAG: glycoside hydrolase 100 family protein [Burkholderiales bacterium]